MSDDRLAQAIANVHAELRDHITAESQTTRDLADEVHDSHAILLELSRELPAIRAQQNVHETRLRKLEMNGGSRIDPAPLARHPRHSELELERYSAELTPAGGIKVQEAIWSTIVASKREADEQKFETERAISELRTQLEAGEEDRKREKSRREGAEQERLRVAEEARVKSASDDAKVRKWIGYAVSAGPVAVGFWEVARWLLVHVLHF